MRFDALLVLMVVIWGVNYSVLKQAFTEIPPQPFNALRLMLASSVFLIAIRVARGRRAGALSSVFYTPNQLTTRDRWDLLWLGLVGHAGYQFFFVGGVAATSVSNGALIIGVHAGRGGGRVGADGPRADRAAALAGRRHFTQRHLHGDWPRSARSAAPRCAATCSSWRPWAAGPRTRLAPAG